MSLPADNSFATVHLMSDSDLATAISIAQTLPQWFGPSAIQTIKCDIAFQKGLVAMLEARIVGFVTFYVADGKGYIGWMAVAPEHHRRGIGRMLIECLQDVLMHAGVGELYVNTLGESFKHEPYSRTRAFYRKLGFADFRRTFSSDPDCPELLCMVMSIKH